MELYIFEHRHVKVSDPFEIGADCNSFYEQFAIDSDSLSPLVFACFHEDKNES